MPAEARAAVAIDLATTRVRGMPISTCAIISDNINTMTVSGAFIPRHADDRIPAGSSRSLGPVAIRNSWRSEEIVELNEMNEMRHDRIQVGSKPRFKGPAFFF